MNNSGPRNDDSTIYAGEAIVQPVQRWTTEEKLALLDWHPLFTGRCPRCETPIQPIKSYWKCPQCDWSDILTIF